MRDRFKFRAWHKPTKKMFEVHCLTDKEVFENTLDGVGTSPTNPANMKDCVLMQCTGLKDKNGNLIYENDIIEIIGNSGKKLHFRVAVSDRNCGYYFMDSPISYSFDFFDSHLYEIVGNIHENPELLEVAK